MLSKIRKKSAAWWKHGKHRSVLMEMRALGKKAKRQSEMVGSIRELFSRRRAR